MSDLPTVILPADAGTPALPADVAGLLEDAAQRIVDARAPNTVRAYKKGWQVWEAWCTAKGTDPVPAHPLAVCAFLEHLAQEGKKINTIELRLAAINRVHREQGHPAPGDTLPVQRMMRALRVTVGVKPTRKTAITIEDLHKIIGVLDLTRMEDIRDRAMLLVGWACALRRSEIATIRVEHVTVNPRGAILTLLRSKTDQEGAGAEIGMKWAKNAICPVAAWVAWVEHARLAPTDYAFRAVRRSADGVRLYRDQPLTEGQIAKIVKARVRAAGIDPATFSGHSLRAGFATAAAIAGKDLSTIAQQTRHKNLNLLHETYVRPATVLDRNPTDIMQEK